MLVSYNWLQTYFDQPLPSPENIRDVFTFHAFEIDAMETRKEIGTDADTIFDVKVLPDRNHYALSHRGMVYELSAILSVPRKIVGSTNNDALISNEVPLVEVVVEAPEICTRYISRKIENVSVEQSPAWHKERLEAAGGRSINSIVDSTNFVMFDMGQPLHAFDADLVKGSINVRYAKQDEKITTLDGKEIALDTTMLVIADNEGPLAIAGIKGGKRAEVTAATKNIILEAATFSASSVRKTSLAIGIRNDSSKRFENAITPVFAEIGMNEVTALIKSLCLESRIGALTDIYSEPQGETLIEVSPEYISKVLGVKIPKEEIKSILKRLDIKCDESSESVAGKESELGKGSEASVLFCHIPPERLDLVLAQDIVEEVGRLYGYDKIAAQALPLITTKPEINPYFYYGEKIKTFLVARGFSEVSTYTLSSEGDFEIEKSASDKKFVRTNLTDGLVKALEINIHNAPLLALNQIKIFEIGKAFKKTGEEFSLAIGISNTKSWKGETMNDEIKKVRDDLFAELGADITVVCTIDDTGGILMLGKKEIGMTNNVEGVTEFNLGAVIDSLPKPESQPAFEIAHNVVYKPISSYPFMLRDIAVFVPGKMGQEESVETMIKETAGSLLVGTTLFDTFTKKPKEGTEVNGADGVKTSYAFKLVFQSSEKTLTDEEINIVMQSVTDKLNSNPGFQVR